MKLIKTKLEGIVWRKVQRAQEKGKALPRFKGHEAEALQRLMSRYPEWERWKKQHDLENWTRAQLRKARGWAYHNLLGFHRHQAMFHPDLLPWAEKEGKTATEAQWIEAAKQAHARRPVEVFGRDTEPVTEENRGRCQQRRAAPAA